MSTTTALRAADLGDLAALLQTQRAQRFDTVVPAAFMHCEAGRVFIDGDRLDVMDEDGVHVVDSPRYDLTDVAIEGLSGYLGVPRQYLRKLAETHVALFDQNINGWLQHETQANRKYLVRILRDSEDGTGVVRAVLTNGYKLIENLDVLTAAIQGITEAGVEAKVRRCDLTDRRMYVTLSAPGVAVEAPRLLDGYRGPWHSEALAQHRIITPEQAEAFRRDGDAGSTAHGEGPGRGFYTPGTEPIIFGGMVLSNSDVGQGAFSLQGQLQVLRCTNGLTIPGGKLRKVHIGERHDVGDIDWSNRTNEVSLELIKSQTRDAVTTFLSADYVAAQVAELEERAGVAIDKPDETIKNVTKALSYSDEVTDSILGHFIAGGQLTAGGVMQAVTSVAQTVASGDDAAAMEADALRALDFAVQYA